jgi:hypothetical protein
MSRSRGNSFPYGIDIHNMGDDWAQFYDQAAAVSVVPEERRTFAWDHHIPMTILAALRTLGLHESPCTEELTIDLPGSSNMEMGALGYALCMYVCVCVHMCVSVGVLSTQHIYPHPHVHMCTYVLMH